MWNSCNKNENLMKEELHKSGMSVAAYSPILKKDSDNIIEILNEIIAGTQACV